MPRASTLSGNRPARIPATGWRKRIRAQCFQMSVVFSAGVFLGAFALIVILSLSSDTDIPIADILQRIENATEGLNGWPNHGIIDSVNWRHTVLLSFNMREPRRGISLGRLPPGEAGETVWRPSDRRMEDVNAVMRFARDRGATIVHICHGCYVPEGTYSVNNGTIERTNDDRVIREALHAVRHCTVIEKQPRDEIAVLPLDGVIPEIQWPFTTTGVSTREACTRLPANAKRNIGSPSCATRPLLPDTPNLNPVRLEIDENPFTLDRRVDIRPGDVITSDDDLIWRVLTYRKTREVLFAGQDANRSLIAARPMSLAKFLARGWTDGLRVLPQITFSSDPTLSVRGTAAQWDRIGARIWASAVYEQFAVRSVCFWPLDEPLIAYHCEERRRMSGEP